MCLNSATASLRAYRGRVGEAARGAGARRYHVSAQPKHDVSEHIGEKTELRQVFHSGLDAIQDAFLLPWFIARDQEQLRSE